MPGGPCLCIFAVKRWHGYTCKHDQFVASRQSMTFHHFGEQWGNRVIDLLHALLHQSFVIGYEASSTQATWLAFAHARSACFTYSRCACALPAFCSHQCSVHAGARILFCLCWTAGGPSHSRPDAGSCAQMPYWLLGCPAAWTYVE